MTELEVAEKIEQFNAFIRAAAEQVAPVVSALTKAFLNIGKLYGIITPFTENQRAKHRHLVHYNRMYARGPKPNRVHKKVRR